MPFGAIFGALVFTVLGAWIGSRLLGSPSSVGRLLGALLVVFGIAVAGGLVSRQRWARWIGVLGFLWLAWFSLGRSVRTGAVLDMLGMAAAAVAAVLLLLPWTGRFRNEAVPASPVGTVPPQDPSASDAIADPATVIPTPAPVAAVQPARRSVAGMILGAVAILSGLALFGTSAASMLLQQQIKQQARTVAADQPRETPSSPSGTPKKGGTADAIAWTDFGPGLEQARQSRRLMLVDFYATWCGPCKMMEQRTFRDPRVIERLSSDFVTVRIDSEEEKPRRGYTGLELAEKYEIMVYPTLMLIDENGREVSRRTGFASPPALLSWLDSVRSRGAKASVGVSL